MDRTPLPRNMWTWIVVTLTAAVTTSVGVTKTVYEDQIKNLRIDKEKIEKRCDVAVGFQDRKIVRLEQAVDSLNKVIVKRNDTELEGLRKWINIDTSKKNTIRIKASKT